MFGNGASGPELRSLTSSESLRTMTSSCSPGGGGVNSAFAGGSLSSRITVRENTAVISRKVTNTVKMSIIGTSSSCAGLRLCRITLRTLYERRMRGCLDAGGGASGRGRGGGRGGRAGLRLALGDGVQEL